MRRGSFVIKGKKRVAKLSLFLFGSNTSRHPFRLLPSLFGPPLSPLPRVGDTVTARTFKFLFF